MIFLIEVTRQMDKNEKIKRRKKNINQRKGHEKKSKAIKMSTGSLMMKLKKEVIQKSARDHNLINRCKT